MKKRIGVLTVCLLLGCVILTGCTKKAASSSEAINNAKALQTTEQKTDYLVGQANAFVSSKEYQSAIDVAQYILTNLDKESQEAKAILEKAKAKLEAAAKAAVGDVQKELGGLLK